MRIDRVDVGGTNAWVIGDDDEVIVVDAPHGAPAILQAVGARLVTALLCTHGHRGHIAGAAELMGVTGAPALLHPDDRPLWDAVHPGLVPEPLLDGHLVEVAGRGGDVVHLPGHSEGSVCLLLPGAIVAGDVDRDLARGLAAPQGGPTRVLPGHGEGWLA